MEIFKKLGVIAAISLLSACSGGSNNSKEIAETTLVTGDTGYAEELAIAAGESSKSLISSDASKGFLPIGVTADNDVIAMVKQTILAHLPNPQTTLLPIGLQETTSGPVRAPGDCGGYYETISTTTTPDDSGAIYPITSELVGEYSDFCSGDSTYQAVMNGTITSKVTLSSPTVSTSESSYDVTYTTSGAFGNGSGRIIVSETCTYISGVTNCTSTSDSEPYFSNSGATYTFEGASVSGDSSSGYDISGVLRDDLGNSYDVEVTGLLQCGSGNISTGTITVTDSTGETVSVSFPNCNECVISYEGNSWTIPQP